MKVEEKPKKLERRRLQENPILVKSDENNLNHSLQESNGKKKLRRRGRRSWPWSRR